MFTASEKLPANPQMPPQKCLSYGVYRCCGAAIGQIQVSVRTLSSLAFSNATNGILRPDDDRL